MTFKPILVATMLVVAALAVAQPGPGGQGGPGGPGGPRMGMGMGMMGGPMMGGQLQLLNRADVQRDLAVTAEQKTKLDELRTAERESMRTRMAGMQPGADMKAIRAEMDKHQKELDAKIAAILTADQVKRLKEIGIQLRGMNAVMDPAVQEELKLTADQKQKLADLQTKQQQANMAIFQRMRDQEITREQVTELIQKNSKTLDEEIKKVLTTDQLASLKAMGGKEFKADPPRRTGTRRTGAGGRRNGGGGASE